MLVLPFLACGLSPRKADAAQRWSLGLEFASWQSRHVLTEDEDVTYGLRAASLALKPSAAVEIGVIRRITAGARLAAIVGTSEASKDEGEGASATYTASGVSVFGGELSGLLRWTPANPGFQLGLAVPISFIVTDLPLGEGIASISGISTLAVGAMVESRLTTRRMGLSLQVGFLQGLDSLAWSVLGEFFL